MEADLEPPNSTTTATTTSSSTVVGEEDDSLCPPSPSASDYHDDFADDYSNSSTPFVSAPSSPGRSFHYHPPGFFYSAPASPMHYVLASATANATALAPSASDASSNASFEFEFSARFDSPVPEIGSSMSSADELFLNGQIRPMKLSAHLQRPQKLAPLIDLGDNEADDDDDDVDVFQRARDLKLRDRSLRRRTRSLSPLRSTAPFDWFSDDVVSTPKNEPENAGETENGNAGGDQKKEAETPASGSASSSRCSSAGRSSKRWVFLKDFLRSKSEGRSNNKFWHNISFSPVKEKRDRGATSFLPRKPAKDSPAKKSPANGKAAAAAGKRRSAHEMHYTMNRAQAEEMRKKTFLPYRQGLLGCLGFNSKSYGALNGFARALNPVSSR